jgi:hypothetical protein
MNELNFIKQILNSAFIVANQDSMEEEKAARQPSVHVHYYGIEDHALYRFDLDRMDFLPFFNQAHEPGLPAHQRAPEGLRKFCDYILLAAYRQRLYILLIELKSGTTEGARQQLEAGNLFMEYIKGSAQRIYKKNHVDFDVHKVEIRKVLITPRQRPMTNVRKGRVDQEGDVWLCAGTTFRVQHYCMEL